MTAPCLAEEPSVPPPPASGHGSAGAEYHELLPDIGLIGAEVGISGGASWNPFGVGQGTQAGGFIDLPLARAGRRALVAAASPEVWPPS